MNIRFYHSICCIFLILFTTEVALSDSPHPDLLKKIKSGEIKRPYSMTHYAELLARGINSVEGISPPKMPNANFNLLVLLVDFSDEAAQTNETYFDTLIYEPQNSTLVDYFEEVTYGNWTIVTANMPGNTGWFRAPDTSGYYINKKCGLGAYPRNSQKLVEDLVAAADPDLDFSPYDNDRDGNVDGLMVIHAGRPYQTTLDSNYFSDVKWQTHAPILVDSVNISIFTIISEYMYVPGDRTIGTFAHEIGHAIFGLPDLYDTDGSSNGLGRWSLMASGNWNGTNGDSPAHPDAWCKMKMRMITPTVVTHNRIGEIISPAEIGPTAYKLKLNGTPSSEYFLVENRQSIGYDAELPGEGLLIYHISDNVSTENTLEWYPGHTENGHYLVALEQADGQWQLEQQTNFGDTGDPFPGSTNNTAFADSTTPDSRGYNFGNTGVAVTNISPPGTNMTADFIVETTFPEHVVTYEFYETSSIHTADMDSDGDMDILGSNRGYINWWENDTNQNFIEHTIYNDGFDKIDIYPIDVDEDGDMDIVSTDGDDSIIWWENDGSENFTEHIIDDDFWTARSVHAEDIDDDGDVDIVGAAYSGDFINWWENDGSE
ncbi:MAG: M6 family metalloprotease domain-containing protein, partial [Calditrichia bacterium]|nr:M6 family metalloprotease domain-containing protein [Calditrichia bacterium]